VASANNVAAGTSTGFSSFTLLDPAIVGDPQSDISVDAGDVSALAAVVANLPEPAVPTIPSGVTITPVGPDPTLSLVQPGGASALRGLRANGVVNVSVQLDHPHPPGSAGMTEAVLALTYDPKVLSVSSADITLGSIPSQGTGWRISSVVDAATGQIGITLYSTTPITATQAGSLVNIAFHVLPGATLSATSVQLVDSAMPNGQQFTTQVDDAQGQFILSSGADRLEVRIRNRALSAVPHRSEPPKTSAAWRHAGGRRVQFTDAAYTCLQLRFITICGQTSRSAV
jgi:hypothetical protein